MIILRILKYNYDWLQNFQINNHEIFLFFFSSWISGDHTHFIVLFSDSDWNFMWVKYDFLTHTFEMLYDKNLHILCNIQMNSRIFITRIMLYLYINTHILTTLLFKIKYNIFVQKI